MAHNAGGRKSGRQQTTLGCTDLWVSQASCWSKTSHADNGQSPPSRYWSFCCYHERLGIQDTAACDCGHPEQNHGPYHRLLPTIPPNGEQGIISLDDDTRAWLAAIELQTKSCGRPYARRKRRDLTMTLQLCYACFHLTMTLQL